MGSRAKKTTMFPHSNLCQVESSLGNWSVSWGRSVSWGWSVGGSGVLSVSEDQLNADLLGESELNLLASGGGQDGVTLLDGLGGVLDLGNGDALILSQVLTADAGKGDWLVDAGADGLRVGNLHGDIDGGNNGHVESGFLGDFLAVLVAVAAVAAISAITGLADGDHLNLDFLNEGDFDSLGGGVFFLLLVGVRADLVGDLLDALSADGADDVVAELLVNDLLDGEFDGGALGLEGRGADLSDLSHILDGAVVLGLLVAVGWSRSIGWSRGVGRSWGVGRSRGVGWGWGVCTVSRGVAAGDEGKKGQESESLERKN